MKRTIVLLLIKVIITKANLHFSIISTCSFNAQPQTIKQPWKMGGRQHFTNFNYVKKIGINSVLMDMKEIDWKLQNPI